MMIKVFVDCPNDECIEMPDYECEYENAGEGSEHELTCVCGTHIKFNIEYLPSVTNEEAV